MSQVQAAEGLLFETFAPVLIVGAGAAGLCSALAAREEGADVVVIERDRTPRGSTALSAGLIPAAETRFQRESGIVDSTVAFAGMQVFQMASRLPERRADALLRST